MKKLISIALVAIMLLQLLPMAIFAKTMDAGAVATTAPTIDGFVNPEEYSWTSGKFDRNVDIENEVHVVTKYDPTKVYPWTETSVLWSQFWMSYDADYIYLAYTERGGKSSVVWFDLNPCVGLTNSTSQLSLFLNGTTNDVSEDTGADALAGFKVYAYSAAGANAVESAADYIVEAKKSWDDDGEMAIPTYEIKISREALADYAARFNPGTTSFDTLGFRAFIQSNHTKQSEEVFFAQNGGEYPAWGSHGTRGYHIFDVSVETETEPPVSESESETEALDIFNLGAYGQKVITLTEGEAANINGSIAEGEYEYVVEAVVANDAASDDFYSFDVLDATYANFYLGADADKLYIATKTDDADIVNWQQGVFVVISDTDTTRRMCFFISDCGDPERIAYDGMSTINFDVARVLNSSYSVESGVTTFEMAFDRAAIEAAFGGSTLDKLLISVAQKVGGSIVLGFENDEAVAAGFEPYVLHWNGLPNVIEFVEGEEGDGPVLDAEPAESVSGAICLGDVATVTMDGRIGENEYLLKKTYQRVIHNVEEVENEFYTVTAHTHRQHNDAAPGTFTPLPLTVAVTYDNEYVYVAFEERGDYGSKIYLDLNPCVGRADPNGQISFYIDVWGTNGVTKNIMSNITTNVYTAKDTSTVANTAIYLADAQMYSYDDGALGVNYIELKIKRSALQEYSGLADFNYLGLRARVVSKGEYYFANKSSAYKALSYDADMGFHVYKLSSHTWSEDFTYNVETPTWGTDKYKITECEVCDATKQELVEEFYPTASGETTYTLWQNNILQNYIRENNYGASDTGGKTDNNGDGSYNDLDSYFILPSATNEMHSKAASRYQNFYATLEEYMPDIVGLQECDLGWHILLDEHDAINGNFTDGKNYGTYGANTVEDGYTFTYNEKSVTTYPIAKLGYASIFDDNNDVDILGVRVPIYYRTDKFECVQSGIFTYAGGAYYEQPFSVAWAILRSIESNEYVAVTSTHVAAGNSNTAFGAQCAQMLLAKIQEIENTYNVPVIAVGDYNAIIPEQAMQVYVGAGLKSGRENALERFNLEYKTSGNGLGSRPGLSDAATTSQIDHCFYSATGIAGDIWDVRIDDNSYADHVPARFTFRIVGMDHECDFSDWEYVDETTHKRNCDLCNKVETGDHNADEVTTNDNGTHNGTCTDCGNTVVENCNGEFINNGDGTHTVTCTKCADVTTATHAYAWASTGTTVNDTHTGTCEICGDESATEKHTFGDPVGDPEGSYSVKAFAKYTCTVCGASYKVEYAPDGHLLTAYFQGQKHFFVGVKSGVAPAVDGKVGSGEYGFALENMNPSDSIFSPWWVWKKTDYNVWTVTTYGKNANTADLIPNVVDDADYYVGYDDEYVYLAAVMSSDYAPAGTDMFAYFRINPSNNASYNNLTLYKVYYNGSNAPTVSVEGKTKVAPTAYTAKVNETDGRYELVYELKLSRAALCEAYGIESFNKLFIMYEVALWIPDGTRCGQLLWACSGNGSKQTGALADHTDASGLNRASHVLFLGSNDDFADYLNTVDDPVLGSYYRACAEHVYRTVILSATGHIEVCQQCGQTKTETEVAHNLGEWTDGAATCADCGYVSTCAHETVGAATSNNNGTHSGTCADCGVTVTDNCSGEWTKTETTHSTTCTICGYVMSEAAHNWTYTSTGNTATDTHSAVCEDCDYVGPANVTHTFNNGVWTTPGTTALAGVKTYSCVCGASYTRKEVSDAHFIRGTSHVFLGNKAGAAPIADGILGAAEYSWTSGTIGNGGKNLIGHYQSGLVNLMTDYASYDDNYIYFAVVSSLEGANAGVARPATESTRIFLGADETWDSMVGFILTYTHANGALASTVTHYQVLKTFDNAGYQNLATIDGKTADQVTKTDAAACLVAVNAKYDAATNSLVYELVIDRAALAAACGNDAKLDRIFFQTGVTGITSAGASSSWLITRNKDEFRGVNYPYGSAALNDDVNRANAIHNSEEFPYINGAFPHVMFLSTKTAQASYIADNAEHSGWNTACTAHNYRLVYAGNDTHKEVCSLCGAEKAAVACTMSAWTVNGNAHEKTCSVCKYVVSEGHDVTNVTDNKNGTHTTTCNTCGGGAITANCEYGANVSVDANNHKKTCSICGNVVTAAHNLAWSSTGNTASDKHTKACSDCGYVAVAETAHSFTSKWTTAGTTTVVGKKTYSCECGASYVRQEVGDVHFARSTPHFFVGNASTVAPVADGILNPAEYNWMSTAAWGSRATAAKNTPRAYVSYDGDYIYIAVTSTATGTRPASEEVRVYLGGSDSISRIVGFKGVFSNGTLTTDMLYFDTTKTVLTCNYNIQDTHASKDAALDALATACLVKSAAKLDATSNTLVYEIVIDRTALATACGADAELDRLFFQPAVTGINASGTADSWLMIKNGYDVRGTNTFYDKNDRAQGVENAADHTYINGLFPGVIFLDTKVGQSAYLADNEEHTGWNTACTAHNYRLVYAGNDTHKEVCSLCGAENTAVACTMSGWVANGIVHEKTCSACKYVVSAAHGGEYINHGDTHSIDCTDCGATGIEAPHEFTKWVVDPENAENHKATCDYCDATKSVAHEFTNYVPNGDATCTEDGTKTAECDKNCGATDTVTDVGSATDHSFTNYIPNGDATCTEDGTKTAECDNGCGERNTVTDVGSATDHSFTNYIPNGDATCTEDGTKTAECDNGCGERNTVTDVGSATDHSFTTWVYDSKKHYSECDNGCGTVAEEAHEYDGNTCTVCGRIIPVVVVPVECTHTWDDGVVTKEATHLEEGEKTFTCTLCGETEVEAIEKVADHEFSEWMSTGDAAHERKCECGETETADHAWNDGEVTKEPTTEATGEKTYTCADCSATKTEELAKLDPPETEPVETEPVETEPVETEPVETEPVETEPVETEPTETEPTETEPTETEPANDGCNNSVSLVSLVLVAVLGVCTVFTKKKRD